MKCRVAVTAKTSLFSKRTILTKHTLLRKPLCDILHQCLNSVLLHNMRGVCGKNSIKFERGERIIGQSQTHRMTDIAKLTVIDPRLNALVIMRLVASMPMQMRQVFGEMNRMLPCARAHFQNMLTSRKMTLKLI